MDTDVKLEIVNFTPFPIEWAGVRTPGGGLAPPGNLLHEAIPPRRGLLLEGLSPCEGELTCGFAGGDAVRVPDLALRPGTATTVRIRQSAGTAPLAECVDAHLYAAGASGKLEPTGTYAWTAKPGNLSKA